MTIINRIGKGEAINLLENSKFSKKVYHYKIQFFLIVYNRLVKQL